MDVTDHGVRRRTGRVLVALSAAALTLAVAPAAHADTRCGDDIYTLPTSPATIAAAKTATLCLLNEQRVKAGLGALSDQSVLETAAGKYALRMVNEHFFSHTAPDGQTFADRLAAYAPPGNAFIGENLLWGDGYYGTPIAAVMSWLNSPEHRDNIFNPNYTDIGIGIAPGSPQSAYDNGATYATEFGGLPPAPPPPPPAPEPAAPAPAPAVQEVVIVPEPVDDGVFVDFDDAQRASKRRGHRTLKRCVRSARVVKGRRAVSHARVCHTVRR